MGTHPRWLKADSIYAQTQRTVDRQFLFKPDSIVRNIIGASAARAQKNHPVKIYWLEFNSNHEQNGIAALSEEQEDLDNLINFKRTFHRLLAGEINNYLGREGAVFSTPSRNMECVDSPSLEQQFYYALTNPVKDNLVERISHWKGFSSYNELALGKEETYTYFDRTAWHRAGGKKSQKPLEAFVNQIRLQYSPLPHWETLKPCQRQSMIRRECRKLEQHYREQREEAGLSVVGVKKLEKTDHRDRPKTRPHRTPEAGVPRIHGRSS